MDKTIGILRQELAAMEPVRWVGSGAVQVLEVGSLGVERGLWETCSVKNVGVRGKEWSVLHDCAFDRVVLHKAVEVCEWPEALLNEVWRVVRPDGLVVIVLPKEGPEGFAKKDVLAMMRDARLKVLDLSVGGKVGAMQRIVPWMGEVWWVLASKDVLNVRPLMDKGRGFAPLRPAGLAGG